MNYVVANRIFLKSVYTQEFEQRFKDRADRQAFKNWVGSDDFKMAHQNPMNKDAFLEGGGLEQLEVIISTD